MTSIGEEAFSHCIRLEEIIIPDSVVTIGAKAFYDCRLLKSFTFPKSLIVIENCILYSCNLIESIVIPENVTQISQYSLTGIPSLKHISVDENNKVYDSRNDCNAVIETATNNLIAGGVNTIIPYGVTKISESAFSNNITLTSISIPDSVTEIEQSAFYGCTSLKDVSFSKNITEIQQSAFYNCESLESISIPEKVTLIGSNSFLGCKSLATISVDENNEKYDSRNNCNAIIETETNKLIVGSSNTVIPYGVVEITDKAFYARNNLVSITIPDSVTYIGAYAFCECRMLEGMTIPDSVTHIGDYAFQFCKAMESIIISDSVTYIGKYAFGSCSKLKNIRIPEKITNIADGLLQYCVSLETVTLPNNVLTIGRSAFSNCISLKSITIPESVTEIGTEAFSESAIQNITIPSKITVIDNGTFSYCSELKNVIINGNVKNIKFNAFNEAPIENIVLPDSVITIEKRAFKGNHLKKITIPSATQTIGDEAFMSSSCLNEVYISANVNSIGLWAFSDCNSLEKITVDENNKTYDSRDNCNAIIKSQYSRLVYGCAKSEFPETVEVIDDYAFYMCKSLKNLVLPVNIRAIEIYAFSGCSGIESIDFKNERISIGLNSFENCVSLKKLIIPNGAYFGENSFLGCSSLEDIIFSQGFNYINRNVFNNCSSIKNITIPNSVNYISQDAFCNSKIGVIHFLGTEEEWNNINIYSDSELNNATVHFDTLAEDATNISETGEIALTYSCGHTDTSTICIAQEHVLGPYATCDTPQICTVCHAVIDKARGHMWGDWEKTKFPTLGEYGVSTRTCSVCNATENRNIDKLKFNYALIKTLRSRVTMTGDTITVTSYNNAYNFVIYKDLTEGSTLDINMEGTPITKLSNGSGFVLTHDNWVKAGSKDIVTTLSVEDAVYTLVLKFVDTDFTKDYLKTLKTYDSSIDKEEKRIVLTSATDTSSVDLYKYSDIDHSFEITPDNIDGTSVSSVSATRYRVKKTSKTVEIPVTINKGRYCEDKYTLVINFVSSSFNPAEFIRTVNGTVELANDGEDYILVTMTPGKTYTGIYTDANAGATYTLDKDNMVGRLDPFVKNGVQTQYRAFADRNKSDGKTVPVTTNITITFADGETVTYRLVFDFEKSGFSGKNLNTTNVQTVDYDAVNRKLTLNGSGDTFISIRKTTLNGLGVEIADIANYKNIVENDTMYLIYSPASGVFRCTLNISDGTVVDTTLLFYSHASYDAETGVIGNDFINVSKFSTTYGVIKYVGNQLTLNIKSSKTFMRLSRTVYGSGEILTFSTGINGIFNNEILNDYQILARLAGNHYTMTISGIEYDVLITKG